MEISIAESEDQQADTNENVDQIDLCGSSGLLKDSSITSCETSQFENVVNPKDKSEKMDDKPILSTESSKVKNSVPETHINSDSFQVSKLELDQHQLKIIPEQNQTKAKEDTNQNQAKVKADSNKVKVKTDVNQVKGKMDANQVKGKTYQNQDKTHAEPDKTKPTGNFNKASLQINIKGVTQPKMKLADQSSSKIKPDHNQIKTNLNLVKSPVKLNPFQIRAAAFEDDNKPKVEIVPKEPGKVNKKYYFSFRVKEFNVMAVKNDLKYKCHVCNGIYRQKFSLKRHFLRNHINPDYISFADISNCKINVPNEKIMQQVTEETKTPSGRKRFKTKDASFLEHNKSRLMPGLYKCHECSEVKLDLESDLRAHYLSHPNVQTDENFPCDHCSAVFQKRAVLNKHVATHHEKKSAFTCKKCKQEFPSDADLQKHSLSYGSGGKCKYCEKGFCTVALRKKHESLHEGIKGYSCKHCHDIFSKIEDVKKHVVKVHASLYLTCPHCPKQAFPHMFATEALLAVHVREKHDKGKKITSYFVAENKTVNGKDKSTKASTSTESVCNYCQKKFPGVRAMFKHKTIAHKKLLHKHKTAAHKKNVLAKKQSTMAAKQKAYNKKMANEKKIQQQKEMADKQKALQKERTTYERKAKQAVQDKSVAERFSTRRIKMESSRMAMSKFYANLSQNIAENLLEHVDGRAHQLSIKEYNFNDNNEFLGHKSHDQDQIPWSSYNFPHDFDVQLALNKRGCEVKPKVPVDEHCLYATGLEKVNHAKENIESVNSGILNAREEKIEVLDAATLSTMNLEEKKKLLQYDPITVYVCNVCKQSCNSFQEIDDHSHNNHPNVEASWIEIEGTKNLPPLVPFDLCRQPYTSPDGVLFSCTVPPLMTETCSLKCTKCKRFFPNSSDLHLHLLECGGNESFRPKYRKKVNMQKRIKHTMKHRIDLSVKQVASKKDSPNKNNHLFKNGFVDKTKVKYGKDYFSTNKDKIVKTQSPLTFQQKNITCFFCKEKFESKLLLTEHYNVCSKFNRKKRGKAFTTNSKKNLNKTITKPKLVSQSETQLINNTNPKSNLQKDYETGLDLTIASSENIADSKKFSNALNSAIAAPVPTNKNFNLSNSANNETFAMDLSVKAAKPTNVPKLKVPNSLQISKAVGNQVSKEKTPIEALHETVQRIDTNRIHRDDTNLSISKNSSQRSQKPASSSEVAMNKNLFSPKLVEPKPTVPNPNENLPKIKEVINEIKRAANSPNHKKSMAPLMFIVSNPDKSTLKNINSTISTFENKLTDQISSSPINQSKDQPFVARRKRKKGQPIKIVQKMENNVIASSNSDSQRDNILVNRNKDENQAVPSQPLVENGTCLPNHTEEINNSQGNLLKEGKLTPIEHAKETADKSINGLSNRALEQTVTQIMPPVSCSTVTSQIPDLSFTASKQDKVATELFLTNKKAPTQCNSSEDRESPTLELLVSSVTQNIENFDKPSFLDDEKFALPSLNINTTISLCDDKAITSARNSLNFRVIIPDTEDSSNSLGSEKQQNEGIELSKLPIIESAIPTSDCSKNSKDLSSESAVRSTELSENVSLDKMEKISQSNDKLPDRTVSNSEANSSAIEKSSSDSPSSKSQKRILVDKEEEDVDQTASEEVNQTDYFPTSKSDSDRVVISSSDEKPSDEMSNHNNTTETIQLPSITANDVPSAGDHAPKQTSTNLEHLNVVDSAASNVEASQNASIEGLSKQTVEKEPVPYDSLESTFSAVIKGGSWRRGRRPSKRGVGRNLTWNRKSHSTDPGKLNLSINSALSPIPKRDKIAKTRQRSSASNVSSQLRAFRIENSGTSNKPLNETLSGKSDHSNSSEVSSDFAKDLASRMKERMRLSFGTVSKTNASDGKSETSSKTLDQNPVDSSALVTSSKSLETIHDVNSALSDLTSKMDMDENAENCRVKVSSIKKEYKEPELSKRHICPYCILEFAYLTNFRRHLKVCKSKQNESVDETPSSSASTSQIQHLPKKEEVEESMLNLLRHQSRQNQMIKETQPVKATSDSEKNFQKFSCESCHKIYFSLFKLMQHRMKEHLMPSAESKTIVSEDQQLDEDSQGSAASSVRESAEPRGLLSPPIEDIPSHPSPHDSQDTSCFDSEDKLEVDWVNSVGNEGSLEKIDQNLGDVVNMPNDVLNIQAKDSDLKTASTHENPQVKDVVAQNSINSFNKSVKEKSSFLQKKYQEVIDPKYFGIPYARGRGRKKKSEVQSSGKKIETFNKSDAADKIELNVNESKEKATHIPENKDNNLKDMKSVPVSPKASSSNELQSKRDIYLTILTNCKKVSIEKNNPSKDSSLVKEIPSNNASVITDVIQHNVSNLTSPVIIKKRGRPRLSSSVKEKDTMLDISVLEINVDSYTVSSEKNGKEISVTKGTHPQNLSLSTTNIPKKRGRKRTAVESVPTVNFPKLKRGKYVRVKKVPSLTPETSEFETDDSASFILSGDEVIPSPIQATKFQSPKARIGAKSLDIPQIKGLKGKQSAIKLVPGLSLNKATKASKSLKAVSLSTAKPAVESSPSSNSSGIKAKTMKNFMKSNCDITEPSTFTKGSPKNSKLHLNSSSDSALDFQVSSFSKRGRNTICPICKKSFSASLLRNRHVQLVHGRKNNRVEAEFPSVLRAEPKQLSSADSRPNFQRHCIKPLPPLKRKYQRTMNNIAQLKKQKI